MVVVSQPSAPQTETVVVEERPNDNLMWVLCLMVVCFCTGNLTAFLCLIPALILSLSVSHYGHTASCRYIARFPIYTPLIGMVVSVTANTNENTLYLKTPSEFVYTTYMYTVLLPIQSGCASNSGDYEAAAGYAKASCTCSVFSVVIYILAFVAGAIVAALLFTVGLGFIGIEQVDV